MLTCLQLRAAIDEYAITGIRQDRQFESTIYSKIFMHLMAMQAKIDSNGKHVAMTQALRASWATTGRCVLITIQLCCISINMGQCIVFR